VSSSCTHHAFSGFLLPLTPLPHVFLVQVVVGGNCDSTTRYIAPTVVRCAIDDALMMEETFGPILAVRPGGAPGMADSGMASWLVAAFVF
jgi:hypothetical protein